MSWLDSTWQVEGDMDYIHLASVNYADTRTSQFDASSKEKNALLPTIFMVSPDYNNFRFGFSITEPYGLSKAWDAPYPSLYAEQFSLTVIDINPTISYKINNIFSIAGGVRLLDGSASVVSDGTGIGIPISRFMTGEATGWGYNLAASARPNEKSNISVTYRSEVDLDLDLEGNVNLGSSPLTTVGKVTVVTPAVLAVSGDYTFFDKLTVDLTLDRTFWSEYKNLDLYMPVLSVGIRPILATQLQKIGKIRMPTGWALPIRQPTQ